MANDSVASSASFYEHTMKYSEENILTLYQHVKMNLHDIQKLTSEINEDMKNIQKDMAVTMKLLKVIKEADADEEKCEMSE